MNSIKSIRMRLGLTQAELARHLGMTQGNVTHYERGQSVPPPVARRLIDFAASRQVVVTFDEIYADVVGAPAVSAAGSETEGTTAREAA